MADGAKERREEIDDLLTSVFNSILRIEEKSLDNRFTEGLTITEIHTIDAVGYREANPMNVVASRLGVTLATLTICVNRLVDKGYLIRERDTADARCTARTACSTARWSPRPWAPSLTRRSACWRTPS